MAIRLEQFVKSLEDSGILEPATINEFVPPKASPRNAEELARELVRHKKLTKFQADQLRHGKGKSLVLGNYVLLEKIGQGGMGSVYKAVHRRMQRTVAVKMLPPATTKDPAAVARFQREVVAAGKLRHTNIVAADDADEANGVHFLVMECVDGSDLSALVKRDGPLPVTQAVNYILQAARGLEYAHAKNVVHRDIKPSNLLLGKDGVLKILDMGLARIQGNTAGQAELTGTGAILGTVDYMAPEQALSTKNADARADIYSLGCTLYYLLTGRPAYDGESLTARLMAHQHEPIPQLRSARPEVPAPLEAIFTKMIAKNVDNRYQTMTEVIADLEKYSSPHSPADPPLTDPADTGLTDFLKEVALAQPPAPAAGIRRHASHPATTWFRDNRKPMIIGGSVLGAVVVLAGVAFGLRARPGTHAESPDGKGNAVSLESGSKRTKTIKKKTAARKVAEPDPSDSGEMADASEPSRDKQAQNAVVQSRKTETQERPGRSLGDSQALQGEWVTIYEECNGEVFDAPKVKEINRRFYFRNNELRVTRAYEDKIWEYDGNFRVDAKAGEFDWKGTGPGGQPLQWTGIYKLTGDRLQICFNYVESAKTGRPGGFKTEQQSDGTCLNLVLRRR